ncbi:SRPBCC family protein [Candidatus Uabimicrobium sp. HlEnr_7]|uniref:SRPBCC family protein n=1 Tax=Candidatus Uabimicrobium helgolandensis TaxID=3095367 RepID=UPI003558EE9F
MAEKEKSSLKKRLKKIIIILMIFVFSMVIWAYYSGNKVEEVNYTVSQLGNKVKGHIISAFDGNAIAIWGVIDAPAEHVWKVIRDKKNFEKYLPYVKKSVVTKLDDNKYQQQQVFELPFGTYEFKHKVWFEEEPNTYVSNWQQEEGVIAVNRGAWIVHKSENKTLLEYRIRFETQWVPVWFSNAYMKQRLKVIVKKLRERIKNLEQTNPEYFKTK